MPTIVKTTLQAVLLSAFSNILAQYITAQRADVPLVIDWIPVYRFVLFTIINTPPNVLWQDFLEYAYPGTRTEAVTAKTVKEGQLIVPEKKMNVGNTLTKLVLDQTVGAIWNTVAFLGFMGAMQGLNTAKVMTKIEAETVPLMLAAYKVWPLVSLLNFTVVPPRHRILFGSLVGVAWGVYLSLSA